MADIQKYLKEYLDYLEIEKNRSFKTRENYERYLRNFLEFSKIKDIKDFTEESVREFRVHLARVKKFNGEILKRITQSYYAIAIRNFLKYLLKRDLNVFSPDKIELPKLGSRQIDILEYSDMVRLLKAPEGDSLRAFRDRAILEVLFSTGLRLSELCNLSRYLDFKRGEISVRGKGDKLRIVFLSDSAKDAILKYIEKRGDAEEFLFVSLNKKGKVLGKITSRAVQRLIEKYAAKTGITKRVTPHQLRHMFATDLLINGADLRSVQEMLGHSNISTTQVYTHLTNKELKEIHETFHGRRRK